MLSPSGKVEWSCPKCGSTDIYHNERMGGCMSCKRWWFWKSRIKKSVAKAEYEKRKAFYIERDKL